MVEASAQSAPLSPEDRLDLEHAMKLLTDAKPECSEFLWQYFVLGLDYSELAEKRNLSYDNVRMKISRCLGESAGAGSQNRMPDEQQTPKPSLRSLARESATAGRGGTRHRD